MINMKGEEERGGGRRRMVDRNRGEKRGKKVRGSRIRRGRKERKGDGLGDGN